MDSYKSFILGIACLILSGCATVEPLQYPVFSNPVTIHVSKDIVSTWTETAAGDSRLPDSQVLVAKQGGGVSAFGGLLGVAIDRSGARSRASGAGNQINQYFDGLVIELIRSSANHVDKIKLIDDDDAAIFKLLPSIRYATDKEKKSLLTFRLTTRYRANGKSQTKDYYFSPDENNFELSGANGWYGEGKNFSRIKNDAFSFLVGAFLDDVTGQLPAIDITSMQRIEWKSPWMDKPGEALLVKQNPDHNVIAPLFRDKAALNHLFIMDRE